GAGGGPEPRSVELRNVAAAALRGVELRRELVRLATLPDEVIGRRACLSRDPRLEAGPLIVVRQEGQHRIEQALSFHEAFEPQAELMHRVAPEVAARGRAAFVTTHVLPGGVG